MWKILVVSDSHGDNDAVFAAMEKAGDYNSLIHLGDVGANWHEIESRCPWPAYFVRGNCDYDYSLKQALVLSFGEHRIYCCHGHMQGVHGGLNILRYTALENECDIALYGHTHIPFLAEADEDVTILNPGSISRPRQEGRKHTFCVITIDDDDKVSYSFDDIGRN